MSGWVVVVACCACCFASGAYVGWRLALLGLRRLVEKGDVTCRCRHSKRAASESEGER